MQKINCFIVGDDGVGKTSLIRCFTDNCCSPEIPRIFDYSSTNMIYEDKPIQIEFCDPIANDDINNIISLQFPKTDVFLVCFSLVSLQSLDNVKKVWVPKIKKYSHHSSLILIGCKCDLKEKNITNANDTPMNECKPIPISTVIEIKNIIKANDFIECSSYTQIHLEDILNSISKAYLHPTTNTFLNIFQKEHSCCFLI